MEKVLNKLAIKKLFYGSTGFGELIWTLIFIFTREAKIMDIVYLGGVTLCI